MITITKQDAATGRFRYYTWWSAPSQCCGCNTVFDRRHTPCPTCKSENEMVMVCECGGHVDQTETVQYAATGKGSTRITTELQADKCSSCQKIYLNSAQISKLDDFASGLPPDTELLPEVGIATPRFLEVLVDAGSSYERVSEITLQYHGIRIRFGEPSRLFKDSLYFITAYDTSDYGHDLSPTLRVNPGPPYSFAQRQALHVILARLVRKLGTPIRFWSVHFDLNEEAYQLEIEELLTLLEKWPLDPGREALALGNAIANSEEPGLFINTFRLLELILGRLLDYDIVQKRRDNTVSPVGFLALVKTHSADLKTRLKRRVDGLPVQPLSTLQELWRLTRPGRGYSHNEVFERIIKFRNDHVHQPSTAGGSLLLPWEIPNYELFARRLLSLTREMLKQ